VAGLATSESIIIPDAKLEGAGIKVVVGEVTEIDPMGKSVKLEDGQSFDYTKLFLATGSSSFIPPIPGHDLQGVVTLRNSQDAAKIRTLLAEARPRHLVFVGAGFITMEVASLLAAASDQLQISVVELCDRPLPVMLDSDMAEEVGSYLKEKGIELLTGKKVEKIVGSEGAVTGVKLDTGETVDAEMVFINVGCGQTWSWPAP
jgi:NADH oxidase (H2O2-forming)